MKASEWAFDRIKEAFELVAQDEAEKMSIVQEIMLRSTDNLRRIIEPVGGQGVVTMSWLCPHCHPLEEYVWWISGGKSTKWWCAVRGENYDWKQPNRLFVVQTDDIIEPQGLCANLINALKLLANQQEYGDDLLQNIVKDRM